jgi:hypothetical protein
MALGDSGEDMVVRASVQPNRPQCRKSRGLVRRRTLYELREELLGTQKLYEELLVAGELRRAGELCDEIERLTQEYVRRRDAPPVRPPL